MRFVTNSKCVTPAEVGLTYNFFRILQRPLFGEDFKQCGRRESSNGAGSNTQHGLVAVTALNAPSTFRGPECPQSAMLGCQMDGNPTCELLRHAYPLATHSGIALVQSDPLVIILEKH